MSAARHPEPAALSRRSFLGRSAAGGVGIALAGGIDTLIGANPASAAGAAVDGGYGALVPDPAGRLALPEGFSYVLTSQAGVTRLDSGELSSDRPDGTASFQRPGGAGAILVQNHEISGTTANPVPHAEGMVYDPGAFGGTTTLVVDTDGHRLSEYVSLAGTFNCAGGRTPWNTWLSCEESEAVPDGVNGLTKRHGYVFEVDPYLPMANRDPRPIRCFGRFLHEAMVVDPDTGEAYLTEDASGPNGLFYRWTPPASALPLRRGSLGRLADDAGVLEAMYCTTRGGRFVADLALATGLGTTYQVRWKAVPDRDAATISTRRQFDYPDSGPTAGGPITRSRKLEGAWWGEGGAYFVASFARFDDGSQRQHDGQVWFYDPIASTVRLHLIFAYTPENQDLDPDGPDNITVSPYGDVIVAEDGEGAQHLIGASRTGRTFYLARNELPGSEEFTGPNFSPDKRILYANVQVPGHTFAIHGPFRRV